MKLLCKLSLKHSRSARLKMCLFVTIALCALVRPLNVKAAPFLWVKSGLTGYLQSSGPSASNDKFISQSTLQDQSLLYGDFKYSSNTSNGWLNLSSSGSYCFNVPLYIYFPSINMGHGYGTYNINGTLPFKVSFSADVSNLTLNFVDAAIVDGSGNSLGTLLSIRTVGGGVYDGRYVITPSVPLSYDFGDKTVYFNFKFDHPIVFSWDGFSRGFFLRLKFNANQYINPESSNEFLPTLRLVGTVDYSSGYLDAAFVSQTNSEEASFNRIVESIDKQTQELVDQREDDESKANAVGGVVDGFITQADELKSKWDILFYPITFTNTLLSVFTGGTESVMYSMYYAGVSGYVYDDSTGMLVPVYESLLLDDGSVRPRASGTSITFPSFTLPGLDVKVWDSYTFDISQVKSWFPDLFNLIYVAVSILELYWFVGFLRSKYEEVFG